MRVRPWTLGLFALVIAAIAIGCASDGGELTPSRDGDLRQATNLLGEPLSRERKADAEEAADDARIAEAKAASDAAPTDAAKFIWYGRILGSANRFREAVAAFEEGAKRFPDDPRIYRFLGHRMITLRRFADAIIHLERAAKLAEPLPDELEPATKPGGAALESMKHAIYYHLGLAWFLSGDFARAEAAYRLCLANSNNPDTRCSVTHWLWMTLMREGKAAEAKLLLEGLPPELAVVEYHAYRDLCRLYRGELDGDAHLATLDATTVDYVSFAFGLANWHLVNGREERAKQLFLALVDGQKNWMAFGCIAAEAEVSRSRR